MASENKKQFDVGILGWWYGKNYGSILTYYGLNQALVDLGQKVLMIHEPLGYNNYRVKWSDDILSMEFARRAGYQYTAQQHYSTLPALGEKVETFMVGSDQLWNPLIGRVNDDLFLDFVPQGSRRVAYATSFGNRGVSKFNPEFVEKHSQNLQKFDAISVREGYAVNTARTVFGAQADLVVDPVFLLPREKYESLAEQSTTKLSGDYLAVFFLDPTPEKKAVALAIADKLGLQRIVVIPNPDRGRKLSAQIFKGDRFEILAEDAPENFLQAYSKANYVLTDSFHGSAFAVIFGKPFSSIYNTRRGVDRFRNLMASLGFDDSRRVYEADTPEQIQQNPNVSFDIDYTKANHHIEAERKNSLRWLKAAVSGQPAQAGLLGSIKEKYKSLIPGKDRFDEEDSAIVERPKFFSNNAAWQITPSKNSTELKVAQGAAVRGNLAWCELPMSLSKQSAYRLTIKWTVRTTGNSVNLHIRNENTGKFRVIGTVATHNRRNTPRIDHVEFMANEDGFTQFMLGAIHFSGPNGGADITSIALAEIPAEDFKPAKPVAKKDGLVEKSLAMAIEDHERFVKAHTKSAATQGLGATRARIMFHAHAIEKGLSRSDFRAGFGKIAVPHLAQEMNGWLSAGRDPEDQFFKSAASVMRIYFQRHQDLKYDVSDFYNLFSQTAHEYIASAEKVNGGVLAAASDREPLAQVEKNHSFLDVVYGRRSVREFINAPVPDDVIRSAVAIAMQAPSVCNRQAARVHMFDDPRAIKAALDIQGGFGGYKMPPKLLLVTADLSAFLFAAERNQPFIDGGLFMMTLLLGLQQMGLGSCSLNTAMNTERENEIRKILGIPEREIFIAFVAVGYYDPATLTPQSKRISVDEVLVNHKKRAW